MRYNLLCPSFHEGHLLSNYIKGTVVMLNGYRPVREFISHI